VTAGALGETVMDCSVTLLPGLEGVEGVEEWVDPPPPPQPIKNASIVNAASTLNVDLLLIATLLKLHSRIGQWSLARLTGRRVHVLSPVRYITRVTVE
jgi:hypothetical protein